MDLKELAINSIREMVNEIYSKWDGKDRGELMKVYSDSCPYGIDDAWRMGVYWQEVKDVFRRGNDVGEQGSLFKNDEI